MEVVVWSIVVFVEYRQVTGDGYIIMKNRYTRMSY